MCGPSCHLSAGILKPAEQLGGLVHLNGGTVPGDPIGHLCLRNRFLRLLRRFFHHTLPVFLCIRRDKPHIHSYRTLLRYHIGLASARNPAKRDRRLSHLRMLRKPCKLLSYTGDDLCRRRNGICPLPWRGGMGRDPLHGYLEPETPLVGCLQFPVGRLHIQHQRVLCDPSRFDCFFRPGHISLFIYRADHLQGPAGHIPIPKMLRSALKCGQRTGKPGFHIAGPPAVQPISPDLPGKWIFLPSTACRDGIHMANEDQFRLFFRSRQGEHHILPAGQHFLCPNRDTVIRVLKLLSERKQKLFHPFFTGTRIRTVNPYHLLRQHNRKLVLFHDFSSIDVKTAVNCSPSYSSP